jgi:hypothetical protein
LLFYFFLKSLNAIDNIPNAESFTEDSYNFDELAEFLPEHKVSTKNTKQAAGGSSMVSSQHGKSERLSKSRRSEREQSSATEEASLSVHSVPSGFAN